MTYAITLEPARESYKDLEPLYRAHYAAMRERLASTGVQMSPYNPRIEAYDKASREGWLLTFV